ncbi:MAG TPA: phage Gp37/Gp68 family protein [Thermodesulfobacteriota bacterium]|nr:phage Gp37/Gp68 family protein [Thermodesulfobacteriota bacterium]
MNKTNIIWCDFTLNPHTGCVPVSEGCGHCYAGIIAERHRGLPSFPNGFGLTLKPHKLVSPYRLKEPALIFINSMSDLFLEELEDWYRDLEIDLMEDTPQHEYQTLTKRVEAMLEYSKRRKLPPNLSVGVSIENNRRAYRIDILRQVDAKTRFLSIEPLLERLSPENLDFSGIDMVITGGESGAHLLDPKERQRRGLVDYVNGIWIPRPERMDWIRDIRDACLKQGVAFLHKQWGGKFPDSAGRTLDGRSHIDFPESWLRIEGAIERARAKDSKHEKKTDSVQPETRTQTYLR